VSTEFLHYLTSRFLLEGAVLAIEIAVVSMALGLVLGLGLALLRLSRHAALRSPAWCYIWFVRGTPLLLQLVFIYDALRAVAIKLDTFTTAIIGFSLNEAAFCAEIIRGGVLSVNRSQAIAAAALGMPGALTLRRIILPQAMRAILPGIANQAISMIKSTSIASVIMVNELTFRAQQIVGQKFQVLHRVHGRGADLSGDDELRCGQPDRGGAAVRLPPRARRRLIRKTRGGDRAAAAPEGSGRTRAAGAPAREAAGVDRRSLP